VWEKRIQRWRTTSRVHARIAFAKSSLPNRSVIAAISSERRIRCRHTGGALGHSLIKDSPNQFCGADALPAGRNANGFTKPAPHMDGEARGIPAPTIIELIVIEHGFLAPRRSRAAIYIRVLWRFFLNFPN
jgi:hypothetical protein